MAEKNVNHWQKETSYYSIFIRTEDERRWDKHWMRPNPCFNLWKLLFARLPVRANVIPDWRRDVASHQRRLKTQLPEDNEGAPTTSTTTTPNRFLRRKVLCAVQLIPIGPRKNISTLWHYLLLKLYKTLLYQFSIPFPYPAGWHSP